jgi:UDP-N-acetyl-alpha-D-muramoyl-L-alanyl-L-glutamate epimerase
VTSVPTESAGAPDAASSGDDRFDPASVTTFVSRGWQFDETSGRVVCQYQLVHADGTVTALEEHFTFPNVGARPFTADDWYILNRLLDHLCVVTGLSYYKLAAPPRVEIKHGRWAPEDLAYHRALLSNGLGEFCWENKLPLLDPTWAMPIAPQPPVPCALSNGPLVPVGGGKDSCVSIEAIRAVGFAPTLVTVRRFPVIQDVITASGLRDVAVERVLDPQMAALVQAGARNGHVPVTAIVTWASLVAAFFGGHDAVILSNERSASEGNVSYLGVEINHQWSKSAEAEQLLTDALGRITPDLRAFSLLRGLSELSIAQRFATTSARYFSTFSSCNGAFRSDPSRRVDRWDATCAKCQFVFLALATVLEREQIESIWGCDVFTVSDMQGFRALLGLTEWKPFECVGESLECRVALAIISERPSWLDHPVVRALSDEVKSVDLWPADADHTTVLTPVPVTHPSPYNRAILR